MLSPFELQSLIGHLLRARERVLVRRPVGEILRSIDAAASVFLDPSSTERQEVEAVLPTESSLSPEMIRHTLPSTFQQYRTDPLTSLLRAELGDEAVLDQFVTVSRQTRRRAYGFPLISQVLAGNLPGAGLDGIIFALLVKSATLAKTASSAPFLPMLFARTLSRVDPDLGACLAVVTWPGGNAALEAVAFSRADVVIASGSDESLAAIRRHVRGRFIGYGHKVSFAVMGKEALTHATHLAQRLAYDVALFDQQGCLSPQLVYVEEGGVISPHEFATLLARALDQQQLRLPRGPVSAAASTAIRRVRDAVEWQVLAGKDVALYASTGSTAWTVIYDAEPAFTLSPLYRTIRVKPLASLAQIAAVLAPWGTHLEAAGVAVSAERHWELAEILGDAGVSRICPLGAMQTPLLSWRHGGRPRIADLVRWVEVG